MAESSTKEFLENLFYASMFNIILFPVLIFIKTILEDNKLLSSLAELAALQLLVGLIVLSVYKVSIQKMHKNVIFGIICFVILILILILIEIKIKITNVGIDFKFEYDSMTWLTLFSYLASYLIVEFVRNIIIKFKNWIFNVNSNDKLVEEKLSFINKIIVGFLSVVVTIVSILVSLKK